MTPADSCTDWPMKAPTNVWLPMPEPTCSDARAAITGARDRSEQGERRGPDVHDPELARAAGQEAEAAGERHAVAHEDLDRARAGQDPDRRPQVDVE
jgi:hypothetical protein